MANFRRPGYWQTLLIAIVVAIGSLTPVTAFAELRPPIRIEASERLFAFVAWLNWIADEDPDDAKEAHPLRVELRQVLQRLPAALKAKHRAVYEAWLPDQSLLVKNGLLLIASSQYEGPPTFARHVIPTAYNGPFRSSQMFDSHLPPLDPALLQEFYAAANLHAFWEHRYRPALEAWEEQYGTIVGDEMTQTMADLGEQPVRTVAVMVNFLGFYGISGQTTFSAWQDRFEIKLNPPIEANPDPAAVARVARHELTHVLMNDAVMQATPTIEPAMAKVAEHLGWRSVALPEMMAQCVELLAFPPAVQESLAYRRHNLLFPYFADHWPAFRQAHRGMVAYLPSLFSSFDPTKEMARWDRLTRVRERTNDASQAIDAVLGDHALTPVQRVGRFQAMTKATPNNELAWYWLGVIAQRDLKDRQQAKAAYHKLLEIDPSLAHLPEAYRPWFFLWSGRLAEAEGQKVLAIDAFQQVLALMPGTDDPAKSAREALARLSAP